MRSMWKGAISFGLVMIPVKLYAATEQKDIAFRQVHRGDGRPDPVPPVLLDRRGRSALRGCGQGLRAVDRRDGRAGPTRTWPTCRCRRPSHRGAAFRCPRSSSTRSCSTAATSSSPRRQARARTCCSATPWSSRGGSRSPRSHSGSGESLATLRTRDGVLVLETLLWPDEVRDAAFPFLEQDIEVRPQELTMASSLIDSMTSDFDPDSYHDNYREALAEVVEAKVAGRELTQPSTVEIDAGPSTSLADALRASLAAAQQGGGKDDGKAIEDGSKSGPAKGRSTKSAASKTSRAKADAEDADGEAPAKAGWRRASQAAPSPALRGRRARLARAAAPRAAGPQPA